MTSRRDLSWKQLDPTWPIMKPRRNVEPCEAFALADTRRHVFGPEHAGCRGW